MTVHADGNVVAFGKRPPIILFMSSPSEKPYETHPSVAAAEEKLANVIRDAGKIKDPLVRAQACGDLLALLAEASVEAKNIRYEAVKSLNDGGMGYGTIANHLGVTKTRLQQVLQTIPPTKRMGRVEMEARQFAQKLRSSGADDQAVVDAVVPRIIEIRSAERYTPAEVAEMLNVPTPIVKPAWTSAKRAKEKSRASK
jgi:hypothetical protein